MCMVCYGHQKLGLRSTYGMRRAHGALEMLPLRMLPECTHCSLKMNPRSSDDRILDALLHMLGESRQSVIAQMCQCSSYCIELRREWLVRAFTKLYRAIK